MITADLPKAPPILVSELDRTHPFRTLPCVQFRYNEAQRPSVVGREIATIVAMRQDDIIVDESLKRQIGRIAAVAMDDDVADRRRKLDHRHQIADRDTLPYVIEPRPGRDAMEIRDHFGLRQRPKLLIAEMQRLGDETYDTEVPLVGIEPRRGTIAEDRKLVGQSLPGGDAASDLRRRQDLLHTVGNYYWLARGEKAAGGSATTDIASVAVKRFPRKKSPFLSSIIWLCFVTF